MKRKGTHCPHCGQTIRYERLRVSTHGMFDMHLFHNLEGSTVDELIDNWREYNETRPHPAIVGDRKVDDLGEISLCPATLMGYNPFTEKDVEIRRVGRMVMYGRDDTEEQVEQWREAMLSDPDIPHVLAQRNA